MHLGDLQAFLKQAVQDCEDAFCRAKLVLDVMPRLPKHRFMEYLRDMCIGHVTVRLRALGDHAVAYQPGRFQWHR